MISLLEGTIELKTEKFVVVNVSGMGYRVFLGVDTMQRIPEKLGNVKVWIHHHVREDSQELYGFSHYAELELFEMLIGISGIGPKGALGIMAIAPVDTLKKAIAAGDTSYLTRVSGVGKKIAEKVILELKDKMAGKGMTVEAPELKDEADALDALVALGYSPREARLALAGVSGSTMSLEKKVGAALKQLGAKK
ncbi:MAG: Holliday junction branch migration protein RuvA [bacterium]|nr:Holliday junction branch migration protein RuvA [bacterium]